MTTRIAVALLLFSTSLAFADDGGAPLPPDPEAPRVGAVLDRSEAHVGDRLSLTITAVGRGDLVQTVHLAAPLELGKLEVLDTASSERDLGDGNRSKRFVLQVAAYEVGELELPSVTLEYQHDGRRTLSTAPITVTVRSLLDSDQAQPQGAKSPREVMVEDRRVWAAIEAAGALALAVLLGLLGRSLLRRRGARPVAEVVVVARPAHEIALERLASLRGAGDFARDGYRPFHFTLTEILRGYVGARYGFDSLELTTRELCDALERIDQPRTLGVRDRIRALLEASDLVKFASFGSTSDEARRALDEVEAIVTATRERPPEAAAPAPTPPGVIAEAAPREGTHG